MIKAMFIALLAGALLSAPASAADDTSRKKSHAAAKKKEKDTGASCKTPAVGVCASCAIVCRPGETATCAPGQVSGDLCVTQPACRCSAR